MLGPVVSENKAFMKAFARANTRRLEWALFPEPTDPEIRQHAVDIVVEVLASDDIKKLVGIERQRAEARLRTILELNKDY